jgi:hypothetical protein
LLLDLTNAAPFRTTRPLIMVLAIALSLAAVAHVIARRKDPTARILLLGFVALFCAALPDMIWGMGHPIIKHNMAPYGLVLMIVSLVAVLERRFWLQRAELERSAVDLREKNVTLAENQRVLEATNEELRHQVEARSRELKIALSGSAPRRSPLRARPSTGDTSSRRSSERARWAPYISFVERATIDDSR